MAAGTPGINVVSTSEKKYVSNEGLSYFYSKLKKIIATKATAIEANTTKIAENTSAIEANTTKIAENTGDIKQITTFGYELRDLVFSTTKDITLSASSWSGGTYTISDDLISAVSNQEIIPALDITVDQLEALQKANLIDGGQKNGSLTLKALGTVPTIDIPIRIIYRGVK